MFIAWGKVNDNLKYFQIIYPCTGWFTFAAMILSLLFYTFLAYMLYRLVFGFIIPIVRTTRRVKRSFRDMQDRMNGRYSPQTQNSYSQQGQQQSTAHKAAKGDDEDYIEFEEVK